MSTSHDFVALMAAALSLAQYQHTRRQWQGAGVVPLTNCMTPQSETTQISCPAGCERTCLPNDMPKGRGTGGGSVPKHSAHTGQSNKVNREVADS